jgi:ribosomal protein S18 acetylase RimI-like enzyme
MSFIIRKGTKQDIPAMMRLVMELATFEREPEAVVNTEKMLMEDGFGEYPIYRVFVAEEAASGDVIGMALYYTAYSTWKGRLLYLDDLVVTENYRQYGIGLKLINEVLKAAQADKVEQIRWQVLDWNTPAIEFYKKLGAKLDPSWINCSLTKVEIADYLSKV